MWNSSVTAAHLPSAHATSCCGGLQVEQHWTVCLRRLLVPGSGTLREGCRLMAEALGDPGLLLFSSTGTALY